MFRKNILIFIAFLAFYHGVKADFCSDYVDTTEDVANCCKEFFETTDDGSKYEGCLSEDDSCQDATCVLEVESVLVDGKFNKTAAIHFAMGELSTKVWLQVFTRAYGACSKLAKGSECPALTLYMCMRPTAFVHCPKSEWTDSEICRNAKRFVKNCQLTQLKPQ